jgi:hypothetical protein
MSGQFDNGKRFLSYFFGHISIEENMEFNCMIICLLSEYVQSIKTGDALLTEIHARFMLFHESYFKGSVLILLLDQRGVACEL